MQENMQEEVYFQPEYDPDIQKLLSSTKASLRSFERFLKAININNAKKLAYLPLIFTNENFLEKYKDSKKLPPLIKEITNFIKDNCSNEKDLSYSSFTNLKDALSNKNFPIELLEFFSQSKDDLVRVDVAQNENCPEDILVKLSNDPELKVISAVTKNASTPSKILDKIYNYNNDYGILLRSYINNPNCSLNLLEKIFNDHIKDFNYLSLQENMIKYSDLTIDDVAKDFGFNSKKIINHPNSTYELKYKVMHKLLDTIEENLNLDINLITIPSTKKYYYKAKKNKIDYYHNFMENNLEIINEIQNKSYDLRFLLLHTTIAENILKDHILKMKEDLKNEELNNQYLSPNFFSEPKPETKKQISYSKGLTR